MNKEFNSKIFNKIINIINEKNSISNSLNLCELKNTHLHYNDKFFYSSGQILFLFYIFNINCLYGKNIENLILQDTRSDSIAKNYIANSIYTINYLPKEIDNINDSQLTLIKKGFNPKHYPTYPRTKSNSCGADSITSKVIAPDGSLYKCWHDMSDPNMSIGNIKNLNNVSDQNIMTQVKYMLFNPFKIEKCVSCNVLPLCMGGCPTVSNKVSCQSWKYSLTETLKQKYDSLVSLENQTPIKEVVTKNE